MNSILALAVFVLAYAGFVAFPTRRSWIACGGGLLLIVSNVLPWHSALTEHINWNVIALSVGTFVLAELFMLSRMPAVLAEWILDRMPTARSAMIAMAVLAGLISCAVENVAVVLLIAPVCFSLAQRLKTSPVKLLVFIAMCSNLQGTATLIGDPPSMILAGFMKLSFLDFFWYQGKPGIFFAVQAGALAATLVVAWYFRDLKQQVHLDMRETLRSPVPTVLMLMLVVGLSLTTIWDPDFKWLAGALTLVLAIIGLIWYRLFAKWGSSRALLKGLDWDTAFFLMGIFAIVGGLTVAQWPEKAAVAMTGMVGNNVPVAFLLIVLVSVAISAFVDNVPYILAMLPVAHKMAMDLNTPPSLLLFGLLVGSCLGGNITPIGATANVVTIGLLKKEGHVVSFGEFMRMGLLFTVAAVGASALFVWLFWHP